MRRSRVLTILLLISACRRTAPQQATYIPGPALSSAAAADAQIRERGDIPAREVWPIPADAERHAFGFSRVIIPGKGTNRPVPGAVQGVAFLQTRRGRDGRVLGSGSRIASVSEFDPRFQAALALMPAGSMYRVWFVPAMDGIEIVDIDMREVFPPKSAAAD
jgi:hypothetical protein